MTPVAMVDARGGGGPSGGRSHGGRSSAGRDGDGRSRGGSPGPDRGGSAPNRGGSPPGRGAGQERVSAVQRSRMFLALVEVAAELGIGQATVAHIVARAGVSRRTFYELFEDREDCFLAAFDHALAKASARIVPAYEEEREWRERIRAGLAALLGFLDDEPGLGALLVVDPLSAGPRALERRAQAMRLLVRAVDEGRDGSRGDSPPLAAEGVVGGVFSILHERILEHRANPRRRYEPLLDLLNELMGMVVMPYLGVAAARRELTRPMPTPQGVGRSTFDPLRELDMRLTYRTIRVLAAVAANPGGSNRRIGDTAGVIDQGQISKLLTRLEHLGLIRNSGLGASHGEPNEWRLTPTGVEVEHAIHTEVNSV